MYDHVRVLYKKYTQLSLCVYYVYVFVHVCKNIHICMSLYSCISECMYAVRTCTSSCVICTCVYRCVSGGKCTL